MSYKSIQDFMTLSDKQSRQLNYLKYTLEIEYLPKKNYSKKSYENAIKVILTWDPESIIKFTLFDKRLIHACQCPRLDNYWKKYLTYFLFDNGKYPMKPRNNIPLFHQAAGTMFWKEYLLSANRTKESYPKHTKFEKWLLHRASDNGSWHASNALLISDAKLLLSGKRRSLSQIKKMWDMSQKNAMLHLTAGFFLHALICAVLGKYYSTQNDMNLSNIYYLQCIESFQLANFLTPNKESQIAIKNSYYGKKIEKVNIFGFTCFRDAFKNIVNLFNPTQKQLELAFKNATTKYKSLLFNLSPPSTLSKTSEHKSIAKKPSI